MKHENARLKTYQLTGLSLIVMKKFQEAILKETEKGADNVTLNCAFMNNYELRFNHMIFLKQIMHDWKAQGFYMEYIEKDQSLFFS